MNRDERQGTAAIRRRFAPPDIMRLMRQNIDDAFEPVVLVEEFVGPMNDEKVVARLRKPRHLDVHEDDELRRRSFDFPSHRFLHLVSARMMLEQRVRVDEAGRRAPMRIEKNLRLAA